MLYPTDPPFDARNLREGNHIIFPDQPPPPGAGTFSTISRVLKAMPAFLKYIGFGWLYRHRQGVIQPKLAKVRARFDVLLTTLTAISFAVHRRSSKGRSQESRSRRPLLRRSVPHSNPFKLLLTQRRMTRRSDRRHGRSRSHRRRRRRPSGRDLDRRLQEDQGPYPLHLCRRRSASAF